MQNNVIKSKAAGLRLLPILVGLAGILISVAAWQALRNNQKARIDAETRLEADRLGRELVARLDARALVLRRMALRWREGHRLSFADLGTEAVFYEKAMPGFQAIGWTSPEGKVAWATPLAGNETLVGSDVTVERFRREAWEASRRDGKLAATPVVDLAGDTKGFLLFYPIFAGEGFYGHMTASFTVSGLVDSILPPALTADHDFSINDGGREIYFRGDAARADEAKWAAEIPVGMYGAWWRIKAWPNAAHLAASVSWLPAVALLLGLMLTLCMVLLARSEAPSTEPVAATRPPALHEEPAI